MIRVVFATLVYLAAAAVALAALAFFLFFLALTLWGLATMVGS